jgi:hypothetical protein
MMFQRMTQDRRLQLQQHLDGYASQQLQTYRAEVTAATAKNAAQSAVQNVNGLVSSNDPSLANPVTRAAAINNAASNGIELGVAAIKDEFKHMYPTAPDNDPRLVEKVNAYQSAAHYGVITALNAQGKDQDAAKYYQDNKASLIGEDADHAAHQVETGSIHGNAMRIADSITNDDQWKMRDRDTFETEYQSRDDVRADPRLEQAGLRQFAMIYKRAELEHNQEQRQVNDVLSQKAWDLKGDTNALIQQCPREWQTTEAKEHIFELCEKIQKNQLPPDGSAAYLKIMNGAHSDAIDPKTGRPMSEEFKNLKPDELASLRPLVSPKDYEKIVSEYEAKQRNESTPDAPGHKQFAEIAQARLAKAGLPAEAVTHLPGKPVGVYNETTDHALEYVGNVVDAWKKNNVGKNPPPEVVNKAWDDALTQAADKHFTIMDMPTGAISHTSQADPNRLEQVRKMAVSSGQPITEAALVNAYNSSLKPPATAKPTGPMRFDRGHGMVPDTTQQPAQQPPAPAPITYRHSRPPQ